MPLTIRTLQEGDWETLRDLRLRALADSPDSFGFTLADAHTQPESYWRGWASRRQPWAAIDDSGAYVGLVSAGIPEPGHGHFGALWVDPKMRGTGLGRRLVELVCDWARDQGCTSMAMTVTEGNPAERLYLSLGFTFTGERHPLREGSALFEREMSKPLCA